MPKPNAQTLELAQFHDRESKILHCRINMWVSVTEHVIQDSTTTTVKDILPTVVQVIHTLIVVDGGVGEDVVAQCKPTL